MGEDHPVRWLLGQHDMRLMVINATTDNSYVVGTRHVIYRKLGIEQGCNNGDSLVLAKPLDMANFFH